MKHSISYIFYKSFRAILKAYYVLSNPGWKPAALWMCKIWVEGRFGWVAWISKVIYKGSKGSQYLVLLAMAHKTGIIGIMRSVSQRPATSL